MGVSIVEKAGWLYGNRVSWVVTSDKRITPFADRADPPGHAIADGATPFGY
jgi:hypothetical protein